MPYLIFHIEPKSFDKISHATQKYLQLKKAYPLLDNAEVATRAQAAADSTGYMKYDRGDIIDVLENDQNPGGAVCEDGEDWDSPMKGHWACIKVPGTVADYADFLHPRLSTTREDKDSTEAKRIYLPIGRRQYRFDRTKLTTAQQEQLQITQKLTLGKAEFRAARFSKRPLVGDT